MGRLLESLERRGQPRVRRQLSCTLLVGGRPHRGVVRDLSACGFFVRTAAAVPPGARVIVSLPTPEGGHFLLATSAPHRSQVSHSLARLSSDGIGLRVEDPSAAYRSWVEGAGNS
jgi:hypothetical protein